MVRSKKSKKNSNNKDMNIHPNELRDFIFKKYNQFSPKTYYWTTWLFSDLYSYQSDLMRNGGINNYNFNETPGLLKLRTKAWMENLDNRKSKSGPRIEDFIDTDTLINFVQSKYFLSGDIAIIDKVKKEILHAPFEGMDFDYPSYDSGKYGEKWETEDVKQNGSFDGYAQMQFDILQKLNKQLFEKTKKYKENSAMKRDPRGRLLHNYNNITPLVTLWDPSKHDINKELTKYRVEIKGTDINDLNIPNIILTAKPLTELSDAIDLEKINSIFKNCNIEKLENSVNNHKIIRGGNDDNPRHMNDITSSELERSVRKTRNLIKKSKVEFKEIPSLLEHLEDPKDKNDLVTSYKNFYYLQYLFEFIYYTVEQELDETSYNKCNNIFNRMKGISPEKIHLYNVLFYTLNLDTVYELCIDWTNNNKSDNISNYFISKHKDNVKSEYEDYTFSVTKKYPNIDGNKISEILGKDETVIFELDDDLQNIASFDCGDESIYDIHIMSYPRFLRDFLPSMLNLVNNDEEKINFSSHILRNAMYFDFVIFKTLKISETNKGEDLSIPFKIYAVTVS